MCKGSTIFLYKNTSTTTTLPLLQYHYQHSYSFYLCSNYLHPLFEKARRTGEQKIWLYYTLYWKPVFFIQKAEFFPALYSCLPTHLKVYTLLLCSVKLKSQWHAKEQTNINQIKASPKNNQPFTLVFSWFTKFILVNPENKKGLCYIFINIHIPSTSTYLNDLWVLYVVIIHH